MISDIVAARYAQAYFQLASEAGDLDGWRRPLAAAARTFSEPGVGDTFANPRLSRSQKMGAAEALLGRAAEPVRNLVRLLVERDRLGVLPLILERYDRLAAQASGITDARVTLAIPADERLRDRITRTLEERLGGRVRTTIEQDPAILGGMVVRIGDRVIDGSLRARLQQLQAALA